MRKTLYSLLVATPLLVGGIAISGAHRSAFAETPPLCGTGQDVLCKIDETYTCRDYQFTGGTIGETGGGVSLTCAAYSKITDYFYFDRTGGGGGNHPQTDPNLDAAM